MQILRVGWVSASLNPPGRSTAVRSGFERFGSAQRVLDLWQEGERSSDPTKRKTP
ncbi:MAG: hypothetical protein LH702_17660 [Phormidesmis sp. CAN_BIN44]|nr:hypothetical protein [Phormidesmis sp. CAN_BIN44]